MAVHACLLTHFTVASPDNMSGLSKQAASAAAAITNGGTKWEVNGKMQAQSDIRSAHSEAIKVWG
jgi:hypothetical protein